jgi:hypothetical protein
MVLGRGLARALEARIDVPVCIFFPCLFFPCLFFRYFLFFRCVGIRPTADKDVRFLI